MKKMTHTHDKQQMSKTTYEWRKHVNDGNKIAKKKKRIKEKHMNEKTTYEQKNTGQPK